MRRQRNPFGVDAGDVVTIGVVVVGGLWLWGKISEMNPLKDFKVPSVDDIVTGAAAAVAAQTGVMYVPPPPSVITLHDVAYPGLMRVGQRADTRWTIRHKGTAGTYTAVFDLLGLGGDPYTVAQRTESYTFDLPATMSEDVFSVEGSMVISVGRGLYVVRGFVKNTDGQTVATWPAFGNVRQVVVV